MNLLNNKENLPVGTETMSSALVEAQNYHRWNYEWIRPHLAGRILDVGGGTGNHIRFLSDRPLVSIDLSSSCVEALQKKHEGNTNWSFCVGDITDEALVKRFGKESFDTVLSCNVFEHIPDHQQAFRHSAQLLKKGGKLVLLLPAHQALYGNMDKMAGHFRRYNKQTAADLLIDSGLNVSSLRYVNMLGGLGWFINNRMVRHDNLSSRSINTQIKLFDRWVIPLISWLEGKRSMPFGQSLLCVGEKI